MVTDRLRGRSAPAAACYRRQVTDPTKPFRSGSAGVVLPPGAVVGVDRARPGSHDESVVTTYDARTGKPVGFPRLLRNLRSGEAARIASRLRGG